jgi:hypothetical protein
MHLQRTSCWYLGYTSVLKIHFYSLSRSVSHHVLVAYYDPALHLPAFGANLHWGPMLEIQLSTQYASFHQIPQNLPTKSFKQGNKMSRQQETKESLTLPLDCHLAVLQLNGGIALASEP